MGKHEFTQFFASLLSPRNHYYGTSFDFFFLFRRRICWCSKPTWPVAEILVGLHRYHVSNHSRGKLIQYRLCQKIETRIVVGLKVLYFTTSFLSNNCSLPSFKRTAFNNPEKESRHAQKWRHVSFGSKRYLVVGTRKM